MNHNGIMTNNDNLLFLSIRRGFFSLMAPGIFGRVVLAFGISLTLVIALAAWATHLFVDGLLRGSLGTLLDPVEAWITSELPGAVLPFISIVGYIFLFLIILLFGFFLASFVVAAFLIPLLAPPIHRIDYPDIMPRPGLNFWRSLVNAIQASLLFVLLALLSLPFFWVPGLNLLIPLTLSALINRRVLLMDVLQGYADLPEYKALQKTHRGELLTLGFAAGTIYYIPVIQLVGPVITATAFIHYGFESLRRLRQNPPAKS